MRNIGAKDNVNRGTKKVAMEIQDLRRWLR